MKAIPGYPVRRSREFRRSLSFWSSDPVHTITAVAGICVLMHWVVSIPFIPERVFPDEVHGAGAIAARIHEHAFRIELSCN